MKKSLLFLLILFCGLAGFSQTQPLSKDHPIAVAAPNLPLMVRFNGTGTEFHGEKYSYNKESNESAFKNWIKNFADEYKSYKTAINDYLKTDPSTLSDSDKEVFTDLKSQYWMLSQF